MSTAHTGTYHSVVRTMALVAALLLVLQSGIVSPVTRELSNHTLNYLASVGVGMYASVQETEINTLSAELSEQQRKLDEREAALREREIAARDFSPQDPDYTTYVLSAILFILTVLILLNYAMDWARVRHGIYEEKHS